MTFSAVPMLNLITLKVVESMQGRKFAAILEEATGTSERTWRTRLKKQDQTQGRKEIEEAAEKHRLALREQLVSQHGLSESEAEQALERNPSFAAGMGLPTADIIYWNSPWLGESYPESIEAAAYFDRFCFTIHDAHKSDDAVEIKKILLGTLEWLQGFFPEDDNAEVTAMISRIELASGLDELLDCSKQIADWIFFHFLTCWDLEFCSEYFSMMEAAPLFWGVLPKFSQDVEIEPDTGHLLRAGERVKRGWLHRPTSWLISFVAVVAYWARVGKAPPTLPTIKEMAAWFSEDEGRIVSWRDETTNLTKKQFMHFWRSGVQSGLDGTPVMSPMPLFVVAHLGKFFLLHENGKLKEMFFCGDDYLVWWRRNLQRLKTKGLVFGTTPWPEYLNLPID